MQRKIILAGQGVALAEMLEADQKHFCDWLQSAELRSQIADMHIPTMQEQMAWFQRVQKPDRRFFSLLALPEKTLIGNCGFVDIDDTEKTATLRITIGNTEHHSKGLGSEAVQLMARYAFDVAGWNRLTLKVVASNGRAIRVYEKSGFKPLSVDLQDGTPIITMELRFPLL